MSYIEGIGDEVAISVAIIIVIMISLLFWSLTEADTVPSSPAHRNSQNSNLEQRTSPEQRENNVTDRQLDQSQTEVQNEAGAELQAAQSSEETTTQEHESSPETEAECESRPTDVRQRRLDFFNKSGVEDLPQSRQNCVNHLTNGSVSSTTRNVPSEEGESSSAGDGLIQIRLKYLDDTERTVRTLPQHTIQEFKRTHFVEELASNKLVRLISNGYVLEDTRTLLSYGLMDGGVIHVQIQISQASPRRPSNEAEGELDIGQFLSPILGVALLCVWIMHFQYKEYFTTTATVALLILSGLFLTVVWGQHAPRTLTTAVQ